MSRCLLGRSSAVSRRQCQSLFFYPSACRGRQRRERRRQKSLWCLMRISRRKSIFQPLCSALLHIKETISGKRKSGCRGRKVSSLYLQKNLKTIIFYIAYYTFFLLQCERCAAERVGGKRGSSSGGKVVSHSFWGLIIKWTYTVTHRPSRVLLNTPFIFFKLFFSSLHAAVLYAAWMKWKAKETNNK